MNKKNLLFAITIGLWVCSCVEPFETNIVSNLRILTVDATLTDLPEEQIITLTESVNSNGSAYVFPINDAKVELLVNRIEKVPFIEKGQGIYALPISYTLKTGSIYQLFFTKRDGMKYESEEEKLVIVPEIIKVHDTFMVDGITKDATNYPANYIYLDIKDPISEKNNYAWSWKLWEKQDVCETCENGRYQYAPLPPGCKKEPEHNNAVYDYYCDGDCWELFYSNDLNVFSDIYSNGKDIENRLIAKIPYYTANKALIEIKQQSISNNAYRYLKLLNDQVQSTGTLVDTPQAAIIGNIKNLTNPDDLVAGTFMLTSIRYYKYTIDRKDAVQQAILPTGLRNHSYKPEPPPTNPAEYGRPPRAKCISSQTRTPTKPKGWVD